MISSQDTFSKIVSGKVEVDTVSVTPVIIDVSRTIRSSVSIPNHIIPRAVSSTWALDRLQIKSAVHIDGLEVEVEVTGRLLDFTLPDVTRTGLIPECVSTLDCRTPGCSTPFAFVVVFNEAFDSCCGSDLCVEFSIPRTQPGLV